LGCTTQNTTDLESNSVIKLEKTHIEGLYVLHRAVRHDERGFFSRIFGADEMAKIGRPTNAVHINSSTSTSVGTLRGIHFQYHPRPEAKIVSCTAGAIWDVGIDLRPKSPTRFKWFGTKLTPENGMSMVIPEGFGHAFITLESSSTAVYVVSEVYSPEHESGIRFDDPKLGIKWPIKPKIISQKDKLWGLIEHRLDELDYGFTLK
jgi:dTDP-4-dehydrorhamnose 3,5-epimerase